MARMDPDGRSIRTLALGLEPVEARTLLSGIIFNEPTSGVAHPAPTNPALVAELNAGASIHLRRPDLPVAAFSTPTSLASFVDPSARISPKDRAVIGLNSLVGPFATIDTSAGGSIKIGNGSAVLDNGTLRASGLNSAVFIGDHVSVGFGATIQGNSQVGTYAAVQGGTPALAVGIGPNALIDGATIEQGVIVGALARVGPGVVVPTGYEVVPGANVTTEAQASNPALGMVVRLSATDFAALGQSLAHDAQLAIGYITLYRGQSATGASIGVASTNIGIDNGDLANITGIGKEPGSASGVPFEPSTRTTPEFLTVRGVLASGSLYNFTSRVTGRAILMTTPARALGKIGQADSIRADDGQPLQFASAPTLGSNVTINSPLGSSAPAPGSTSTSATLGGIVTFGSRIQVGTRAVILGGPTIGSGSSSRVVGDGSAIGQGAVIDRSSLGANDQIGARSYVEGSILGDSLVVPPGTIIVNNRVVGTVRW